MKKEKYQSKVNEIQEIYRSWSEIYAELEKNHLLWQKSIELMQKMEHFYFDGEFQEIYHQMEEGLSLDLTTKGEYSVMSEDTIWNALHEHQSLLWKELRLAVANLDTNK